MCCSCRLCALCTPVRSSVATGTWWLWFSTAQSRARTPETHLSMSMCTMISMSLVRCSSLKQTHNYTLFCYCFVSNTNVGNLLICSSFSSFFFLYFRPKLQKSRAKLQSILAHTSSVVCKLLNISFLYPCLSLALDRCKASPGGGCSAGGKRCQAGGRDHRQWRDIIRRCSVVLCQPLQ